MKHEPGQPVDFSKAKVLGAPQARQHGTLPWDPAESDVISSKACPFTSGPISTPRMDGQNVSLAIGVKYMPCHRKCALFVRDDQHPDKGYCTFAPPYLAGQAPAVATATS